MDLGLGDRVALVTGASRGIGRAVTAALLREGARVVAVARDAGTLARLPAELGAATDRLETMAGDVSNPSLGARAVAATLARWSRIDVLVCNAGGPPAGDLEAHDDAAWDGALAQNLLGSIRLVRAAVPAMKAAAFGRIVAITSTVAREPSATMVLSATARAGLSAFLKSASIVLAPHGITVNSVAPGGVKTERLRSLFQEQAMREGRPLETILGEASLNIPMRRFADPEELADVIVFLCSVRAGYLTGTSIAVDGGLSRALF